MPNQPAFIQKHICMAGNMKTMLRKYIVNNLLQFNDLIGTSLILLIKCRGNSGDFPREFLSDIDVN